MTASIIQKEKECFVCGATNGLHCHEIYFGAKNRRISKANGFTVYLCARHHNLSGEGVHFDKDLDTYLKETCQMQYENTGHSRQDFMALVGRNYL